MLVLITRITWSKSWSRKPPPKPRPAFGEERVDRSPHPLGDGVQFIDTLQGGEICLYRLDCRAKLAKVLCGFLDLRLVSGRHQIEAILRTDLGELVANAGGRAGDKGEGTSLLGHRKNLRSDWKLMQSRTGPELRGSPVIARGELGGFKS
jgi:hypothetical protein